MIINKIYHKKITFFFLLTAFSSIYASIDKHCQIDNNQIIYVPLNKIMSGQPTVSKKIIQKISIEIEEDASKELSHQKKPTGFYLDKNKKLIMCFNNGTSPFNKEFLVIKTNNDVYILEDSHHTLISKISAIQKLGGNISSLTIPIKIDESFNTPKDIKLFIKQAQKENKIYIKPNTEFKFINLKNIPNNHLRYFIESASASCSEKKEYKQKTKLPPFWLHISGESKYRDKNFVEFYIEELLEKNGFTYKDDQEITLEMINRAREIMLDAKNSEFLRKHKIRAIDSNNKITESDLTPEEYCNNIKNNISQS